MSVPPSPKPVGSATRLVGPWGAIGLAVSILAVSGLLSPGGDRASTAATASPADETAASTASPEELYARVAPSVVMIVVLDEGGEEIASGSGFVLHERELSRLAVGVPRDGTSDETVDSLVDFPIEFTNDAPADSPFAHSMRRAYVVTNYHVIESAVTAEVQLADGAVATIERVIAEDEGRDLALLAVDVPVTEAHRGVRLAPLDPPVFTPVYAIGSPRGLTGTASMGHVSGYRSWSGIDWLQTTAPISPGSSGGPLLLADGSVAGVTTMTLLESQNLNFAVPASAIHTFLAGASSGSRDLAEGASLAWHVEEALRQLRTATGSSGGSSTRENQVVFLDAAWRALKRAMAAEPNASYERSIRLAEAASTSLPREFRYLSNYLVGKAQYHLALVDVSSAENGARVADEPHIRYRASPHAEMALDRLEEAARLKPDFPPAHACLALHHARCGNWPAALLAANEVVRLMPRCAEALAHRAECFRQLGQPDTARLDLEAATRLSPRDGHLNHELAQVLVDLGEYDEAIRSYLTALDCDAPDLRESIHYHLGIAYRKAGNLQKARTELVTAKALGWPAELCNVELAACGERAAAAPLVAGAGLREVSANHVDTEDGGQAVYVTKTGKKYHRDTCRHISRSKISIPLVEAADTYSPCTHCRPLNTDRDEAEH